MEILIAMALIAVSLVPAMEAIRAGVAASSAQESETVNHFRLFARMEHVLAQPFDDLDAAALAAGSPSTLTSYSDRMGTTDRRLVFLSRYDADNADGDDDPFTGTDADLLWVRATIADTAHALETLRVR